MEFRSLRLKLYTSAKQTLGLDDLSETFASQRQQLQRFGQRRPLRQQLAGNIGGLRMTTLLQQQLSLLQPLSNRRVG